MAGEKYADKAVSSLLSFYQSNLQTYLTAVETAQSLDTGSLTPPIAYVDADLPKDTRSPLFQVFCNTGTPEEREGNKQGLYVYDCVILVDYVADADSVSTQRFTRRYMTALVDTLRSDHTLGGAVVEAVDGEQNLDAESAGDNESRRAIALAVSVTVDE